MRDIAQDGDVEDDLLAELLSYKEVANKIDMGLPPRWNYRSCPHCNGLNAFEIVKTKKNVIYECDWCYEEFK